MILLSSCVENKDLSNEPSQNNQFCIMSTTDIHGKIWSVNLASQEAQKNNMLSASTIFKNIKKNFGEKTFIFDNGDLYQGTYESTAEFASDSDGRMYDPAIGAMALSSIGYDGYTLGNHEFNYKFGPMSANYDYLSSNGVCGVCANLYDQTTGERLFQPYLIKNINVNSTNVKVAVIGLENTDIPKWDLPSNYPNMIFHSPENPSCDLAYEVSKVQSEMKADNVDYDFLIVSAHTGLLPENDPYDPEKDYQQLLNSSEHSSFTPLINTENQVSNLCCNTHGVDMIISGHDHVAHYSNMFATNNDGNEVLVVNAAGKDITKTVVNVDKDPSGKLNLSINSSNNIHLYDYEIDSELESKLSHKISKYENDLSEVCGEIDTNWDDVADLQNKLYTQQNDSLDLINRVQMYASYNNLLQNYKNVEEINNKLKSIYGSHTHKQITADTMNIDVSFTTTACKNPIESGKVTIGDVCNFYRYDNTFYAIAMTGQEIKDALELNAAERLSVQESDGKKNVQIIGDKYTYTIAYGLNFVYDFTCPEGSRVKIEGLGNGRVFDLNNTYLVSVNNYLIGNISNAVFANFDKDKYINVLSDNQIDNQIRKSMTNYLSQYTYKYGRVYNTKMAYKNDEPSSKWSCIVE